LTVQAPGGTENEDAVVAEDGVVVVVDGAGLPAHLRTGCRHSVAWFARSVAHTFHALLVTRSSSMRVALAETISRINDSHATTCDLAGGSPSATVAAWRIADDRLEYLVLSDASIVLLDRHDRATEIVDHRLENVTARAVPLDPEDPAITGTQVRAARRAAVESARNQPGGFWCVHTDPSAADQAMHGTAPLSDLAGVVACSDGGARGYELLGAHTLEEFTRLALCGQLEALADTIRAAENHQAGSLQRLGVKVHDDITIVALPLTDTLLPTPNPTPTPPPPTVPPMPTAATTPAKK
jgi:hypothetical protein